MVTRRAKALMKILGNMTIYIQDNERLVGNMARDLNSLPLYPELYWRWLEKALDNEYQHLLDDEGKRELKEINKYWKNLSVHGMERNLVPPDVKPFTGYTPVTVFSYTWDMVLPDYEKILKVGLKGIIEEAQNKLKEITSDPDIHAKEYVEQKRFLEAAIMSLEATISFSKRYAALAREKAAVATDPEDKKRLETLAEICDWVPENPARTFHEAMQCFFLIHLITGFIALPSVGCGVRLDKVMYPYYEKDIETERLTKEEALNLVESLWIKFEEMGFIHPPKLFGSAGGGLAWQNVTLGGVDEQGNDITNDLSYLILDATKELHSVQPPLCFRYHDRTPRDLVLRAIDTQRTGVAQPAFFNDKMMIPYLLEKGIPLEDARDYTNDGCSEILVQGKTNPWAYEARVKLLTCLERVTERLEECEAFEEVMAALKEEVSLAVTMATSTTNLIQAATPLISPNPLISATVGDCIEKALDLTEGGAVYNTSAVCASGVADTADGLAALKKLVYEEGAVGRSELLEALRDDFEGRERLRLMLLNRAPKFGNDDEYVDSIAAELVEHLAVEVSRHRNPRGGRYILGLFSYGMYIGHGIVTGATPDGRKAGAFISPNFSPSPGRDRKGPFAALKSTTRVDQMLTPNGTSLDLTLHPSAVRGPQGVEKLMAFLRAFVELGGMQVQFNIADAAVLREAQAEPEKHRNLTVRLWGFPAYFVRLPKEFQNHIIARTEHSM